MINGRTKVDFSGYEALTKVVSEGNAEKLRAVLLEQSKLIEAGEIKKSDLKTHRKALVNALVDFTDNAPTDDFYASKDYPKSTVSDLINFFLAANNSII